MIVTILDHSSHKKLHRGQIFLSPNRNADSHLGWTSNCCLNKIMPHASTAVESGERLIVTLFSPGQLMEWGTRYNEDWHAEEVEIYMWKDGQVANVGEELDMA